MLLIVTTAVCVGIVAALCWLLRQLVVGFVTQDVNQVNLKPSTGAKQQTECVRVLAFGDDWTEGITFGGQAFHPYAKALGDHLHPQLPLGIHLEVEEQGKSGSTVLGGMKGRLQHALDKHAAAGRPYNWVLLQGGINDLMAPKPAAASEVLAGLDVLVQSCLAHGASVLLMTLLEVASPEAAVEAQRTTLNAAIRDYVAKKRWQKAPDAGASAGSHGAALAEIRLRGDSVAAKAGGFGAGTADAADAACDRAAAAPEVVLCDLATFLPYSAMSEQERFELWHNDMQLTVDGYEAVGLLLSNAVAPRIKRQLASQQATA